jgi:hypothetical protein
LPCVTEIQLCHWQVRHVVSSHVSYTVNQLNKKKGREIVLMDMGIWKKRTTYIKGSTFYTPVLLWKSGSRRI